MNEYRDVVFTGYNVLGDDIYFHHTLTEGHVSYQHPPEAHTQYEVLYLLEGELTYVIDGASYRVDKGDMIFVAPNEIHSLDIAGGRKYERAVLLFDMSVIRDIMRRLGVGLKAFSAGEKNSFHVIRGSDVKNFGADTAFMNIINCDEDNEYKHLAIIARLISLVIVIDRIVNDGKVNMKQPYRIDPLVLAVNGYVDKHILEPISLDGMAEALYISKSTLCHKFASSVGLSVKRYVTMKKMYKAADMLRDGVKATDVAEDLGYDNYATFFYNYKNVIGTPPSGLKPGAGD